MFDVFPLKMPPRPLHRWKSFWLGLFVLVFLCWAWWTSMNQIAGVTWAANNGVRQVQLSNYDAMVHCWIGDNGYHRTAGLHWDRRKDGAEEKEDGTWFQPGIVLTEGGGSGLQLAHWFIILLFLIPWVGFLIWRIRRMRRAPSVED